MVEIQISLKVELVVIAHTCKLVDCSWTAC